MVRYKCNQCGQFDSDRSASPAMALICWDCKAGMKGSRSVSEQLVNREGMFPIDDNGKYPWEI